MPVSADRMVAAGLVLFLSVITFREIMGASDMGGGNSGMDKVPVKSFTGPVIKFFYWLVNSSQLRWICFFSFKWQNLVV